MSHERAANTTAFSVLNTSVQLRLAHWHLPQGLMACELDWLDRLLFDAIVDRLVTQAGVRRISHRPIHQRAPYLDRRDRSRALDCLRRFDLGCRAMVGRGLDPDANQYVVRANGQWRAPSSDLAVQSERSHLSFPPGRPRRCVVVRLVARRAGQHLLCNRCIDHHVHDQQVSGAGRIAAACVRDHRYSVPHTSALPGPGGRPRGHQSGHFVPW